MNGGGRERREPWGESCVCTNSGAVVEKGFALRGRARANADRPPSHLLRECTGLNCLVTAMIAPKYLIQFTV